MGVFDRGPSRWRARPLASPDARWARYNVDMASPNRSDNLGIDLPVEALADFCRTWKITELALFGSALRDDFGPDSDIDFLATFSSEADWSLLDHAQMEIELVELLGRKVDLLTRRAVEHSRNPMRRREILTSARTIYAA